MPFANIVAALLRSHLREMKIPPPPPLPAGLAPDTTVLTDAQMAIPEEAMPGKPAGGGIDCLGCIYGMMYRDIGDRVSWRRVTVRGLTRDYDTGEVLLRGYCHERHAPQHFRASRIQEMVDLSSGESIDQPKAFFARCLSDDPTFRALRASGPALQVLAFIARCDGNELPAERAMMIKYVRNAHPDMDIDAGLVERHIRALLPDEETFQSGLAAFEAMSHEQAVAVVECAISIVESDGVVGTDERKWLDEIKAALR